MTFVTDGNGRFTFDEVLPVSVASASTSRRPRWVKILGFSNV